MKPLLMAASVAAVTAGAGAPAHAHQGHWTFNPRLCPDLVEDRYDRVENRRDRAHYWGPLDVVEDLHDYAEDRRDYRRVSCPARAFHYVPGHGHARPHYRHHGVVYVNPHGHYYHRDPKGAYVRLNVVIR